QTGEMALRVLKGEKPQNMPIERQKDLNLVINEKAAKKLGIAIPDELKKKASKIIE
ncbi:MAG TPA: ABC transporter substrate-binding protein, partial [Moorella mulderi]|nr:ABC transporter substrate-binding protein [Moorella mulderi]